MKYTKIYIGSDNKTKKIDYKILKNIINRYIMNGNNYTIIKTEGYFEGIEEETAILEIYGNFNLGLIEVLKEELKQNSIMVVYDYKEVEFI